jgi:hypothetical protein
MAIIADQDGELDIESLTDDDKENLRTAIQKWVHSNVESWKQRFPTMEEIYFGGEEAEVVLERLEAYDNALVWCDVTFEDVEVFEVAPGVKLVFNGYAYIPGKDPGRASCDYAFVTSVPWTTGERPVLHGAQAICIFCQDGFVGDEECQDCEGSKTMFFEA